MAEQQEEQAATDEGLTLLRNLKDEARYAFCRAYDAWIAGMPLLMSDYEGYMQLWMDYVRARDSWMAIK